MPLPLQHFVDYVGPPITAAWLNQIDQLYASFATTVNGNITIREPINGEALTVLGAPGEYALHVKANLTAGQSKGLLVDGGTSTTDVALMVRNAAGASEFMRIDGLGVVWFGGVAPNTAGHVLISGGLAGPPHWGPIPGSTGANPTAQVGLAAVNGVATTYMRSDAAPALDQAIAPTWTGQHVFNLVVPAPAFIPTGPAVPPNGMYLPAANTLGFATAALQRMVIAPSGNVGIGVATPGNTIPGTVVLEVRSPGITRVESLSTGNSAFFNLGAGAGATNVSAYFSVDNAANIGILSVVSDSPLSIRTADLERINVSHFGNVTINMPSVNTALLVHGVDSATEALRTTRNNDGIHITMQDIGGNLTSLLLGVEDTTSGYLDVVGTVPRNLGFRTGGIEHLHITPLGEWGLGGSNYGISGYVLTTQGPGFAPVWASIPAIGGAVGANPTAQVTLAVQNGVAPTFMRSDAAPALSQAITPAWTGKHTFSPTAASGAAAFVGDAALNNAEILIQNIGVGGHAWRIGDGIGVANGSFIIRDNTAAAGRFVINDVGAIAFAGSGFGTAGQVLTSGGPGAPPTWAAGGGGGGVDQAANYNWTGQHTWSNNNFIRWLDNGAVARRVLGWAGNDIYVGDLDNTTSNFLRINTKNNLYLQTDGVPRVTINAAGNVTINAPASGQALTVNMLEQTLPGNTAGALFSSTSKAIRFTCTAAGSYIEGTDQTGAASFQPLSLGGSTLALRTLAVDRVLVSGNGNVTINAPSIGTTLTLQCLPAVGQRVLDMTGTTTAYIYQYMSNTGGSFQLGLEGATAGQVLVGAPAYGTVFSCNQGTSLSFGTASVERMRIGLSGNVTIAAPTSGQALTVNTATGSIYSMDVVAGPATTDYAIIRLRGSASQAALFGLGNAGGQTYSDSVFMGSQSNHNVNFIVADTIRFQMLTSGVLSYNAPAANANYIQWKTAGTIVGYVGAREALAVASPGFTIRAEGILSFCAGSNERMTLDGAGNLNVVGIITGNSDIRLKDNIVGLSNQSSQMAEIKSYRFNWKESGQAGIGFIAQEVEKVYPEMVLTSPETGMKSVNYMGMTVVHHVELVEQRSILNDLTRRVETLEAA